jgi:hypothetical protein
MTKEESKQKFIDIYNANIKRAGSKELLDYLLKSDFFDAPASTKFHSAYEGGLCEHSINVYNRFLNNLKNEYGDNYLDKINLESITICGLLHDICKVGFYKSEMRNVKVDGNWTQQPYYTVEDSLPYGHGEKSVYIISGFLRLSRYEAMIINWHMGAFDQRVMGGFSLSQVFTEYPLVLLFNVSDMEASYLDETR